MDESVMQGMMKAEVVWFLLGVLMIFCEMFMPGLVIIFFGAGAILTALCCMLLGVSLNVQLVIFGVSSVVMLLLLRNTVKKVFVGQKVREGSEMPASISEFIGSRGTVVEKIDARLGGRIELNGSEWKAQSQQEIAAGMPVVVIGQDNLTLIVKAV
ncbi:MAG: NfeD family protein [Sedimentisphaerales bacterium]|nr:NfeD family protein [Sedimentisphaerales bacterium]